MPSTPLAPYLSMKTGGSVRNITPIVRHEDVMVFVEKAQKENLSFVILGGGTNTLLRDGDNDIAVGLMQIKQFEILEKDDNSVLLSVGAGENWDSVVERAVAQNLQGIEALSAIPGTAGATPIQNVGAYGTEIKDVLEYVETYDTERNMSVKLNRDECQLAYRDSLFKHESKRFVITNVVLRLKKNLAVIPIPDYKDVKAYFVERNLSTPSLVEVRDAIIEIRKNKLPDPSIIPNCGSFFKNPTISVEQAASLKNAFANIVTFPVEGGVKVSAGWLVDQCGFKGQVFGNTSIYANNALVITAQTGATTANILNLAEKIISAVKEKFGIVLEREPILLP